MTDAQSNVWTPPDLPVTPLHRPTVDHRATSPTVTEPGSVLAPATGNRTRASHPSLK